MATFEAQVEALTSLSIAGGTAPTQTELTQFLTDGAKEVINNLPDHLLALCSSEQTFTSGTPQTLNTGKVLYATRSDGTIAQPCRLIPSAMVGRALDSGDMTAASTTDPIYYIKNNTIDIAPSSGASVYSEVQYPAVAFGDSAIAVFPDEAEYLVVLYASIKSLQNVLSDKSDASTTINTAFVAVISALNQATAATDKFESADTESVFGDEDTFLTASSQLTRVKAAIDSAESLINGNQPSSTTDAFGALADEDIELVGSSLSIAQTEMNRAQAHLSEWVAIGDMRAKEANIALSEAQGYTSEIQARLNEDSTKYGWYEKQQAKLQVDYDKGLAQLIS